MVSTFERMGFECSKSRGGIYSPEARPTFACFYSVTLLTEVTLEQQLLNAVSVLGWPSAELRTIPYREADLFCLVSGSDFACAPSICFNPALNRTAGASILSLDLYPASDHE